METLMGLMLSMVVLVFMLDLNHMLGGLDSNTVQRQNRIGLIQLRRMLSLGRNHTVRGDETCMDYQAEETCFYLTNGRLIQTPGTQIYLIELEDIEFELEDRILSMTYWVLDQEFHVVLTIL